MEDSRAEQRKTNDKNVILKEELNDLKVIFNII